MTLRSLILANGSSLGDAARACEVDVNLFDRIDNDRQPLPRSVAEPLAGLLGLPVGTVMAEAARTTNDPAPIHRRPVPPIPGQDFDSAPDRRATAEVPTGKPDAPQIWPLVVLPFAAGTSVRRVDRLTGAKNAELALALVQKAEQALAVGGLIWSAAVLATGTRSVFAIDRVSLSVAVQSSFDYDGARSLAYEPTSDTIWIAQSGTNVVTRIDRETGDPDLDVALSIGPTDFLPRDLCALGGFVYAVARDAIDTGQVWRIDPSNGDAIALLDSPILFLEALAPDAIDTHFGPRPALWLVARDPNASLYVLTTLDMELAGTPTPYSFPPATLIDPASVAALHGLVWISDTTNPIGGDAALVRISKPGAHLGTTVFAGDAAGLAAGRSLSDGVYVWTPDPQGALRKIHPTTGESLLASDDGANAYCAAVFL